MHAGQPAALGDVEQFGEEARGLRHQVVEPVDRDDEAAGAVTRRRPASVEGGDAGGEQLAFASREVGAQAAEQAMRAVLVAPGDQSGGVRQEGARSQTAVVRPGHEQHLQVVGRAIGCQAEHHGLQQLGDRDRVGAGDEHVRALGDEIDVHHARGAGPDRRDRPPLEQVPTSTDRGAADLLEPECVADRHRARQRRGVAGVEVRILQGGQPPGRVERDAGVEQDRGHTASLDAAHQVIDRDGVVAVIEEERRARRRQRAAFVGDGDQAQRGVPGKASAQRQRRVQSMCAGRR